MFEIQAKIESIFSKHSQYIRIICHNMDIEKIIYQMICDHHETFHKSKYFSMQSASKNKNSNQQYSILQKRKIE